MTVQTFYMLVLAAPTVALIGGPILGRIATLIADRVGSRK